VERAQLGQGDGRKPAGIALTALRDLDNRFGQGFLYDRRLAIGVQGQTGKVVGLAQSLGRLGVEPATPENGYGGVLPYFSIGVKQ
jgi:hypothetical protein